MSGRLFEYEILIDGKPSRYMKRVMSPEQAEMFILEKLRRGNNHITLRATNLHWEIERAHVTGDWPKTWSMVTDSPIVLT